MSSGSPFPARLNDYVLARKNRGSWAFRMSETGWETLYASCFAAMTLHYTGHLATLDAEDRAAWSDFILSHQDPETGYFIGPEIAEGHLSSRLHDREHLLMHLGAHALPALAVLGARPRYPLRFCLRFAEEESLLRWLERRNWREAWIEGNNLLFVGQFLTHLHEVEGHARAGGAVSFLLDWLDRRQDPATGLWGTDGFCDKYKATYGAYHQLLLYHYWRRPIRHARRLVDTVLSLQHVDGGFSRWQGGGTCQDVDAVDILTNLYKIHDYRRREIRRALRRVLRLIVRKQTAAGGFVSREGHPFIHMGMQHTATPAGVANMFSTWFVSHTIFLIAEVLGPEVAEVLGVRELDYAFNETLSMGWHRKAPIHECVRPRFLEVAGDRCLIGICSTAVWLHNTWSRRRKRGPTRSSAPAGGSPGEPP